MEKTRGKHWRMLVLAGLFLCIAISLFTQSGSRELLGTAATAHPAQNGTHYLSRSRKQPSREAVSSESLGKKVERENHISREDMIDVISQGRRDALIPGSNIDNAGNSSEEINLYSGIAIVQKGFTVRTNVSLFGDSKWHEGKDLMNEITNNLSQHSLPWLPGIGGGFTFPFWPLIIWITLGLLLTSLLPEHVMFVRTTVTTKTRRSLLLGLLSLLLTPIVLIVLITLIIPIPMAIILVIGLIAAWALGTIAIGWLVGEYIVRAFAPEHNTRLVQVAVGLAILVLVGSLPYIGWIVSLGIGLLGLGAVFLSRFGTRLYSQPKQPLKL